MTCRRVIASKVTGPTKRVAECVITATTSWPRFCSPRATSTALYAPMPPVTPSATKLMDYSTGGLGSGSIFSTALVATSVCATVVFLCSPTATRGVDPASSCRARAPAVTTNSNELGSLVRSIMKCPDYGFGRGLHPLQPGPFRDDDGAQPVDRGAHLVVDDDEIIFGEGGHLVARHLQPPLNVCLAVLPAAAQPLLEHVLRRRHQKHARDRRAARAHLARALDVDDEHDVV